MSPNGSYPATLGVRSPKLHSHKRVVPIREDSSLWLFLELLLAESKTLQRMSVSLQVDEPSDGGDDAIGTGLQRDQFDKCR